MLNQTPRHLNRPFPISAIRDGVVVSPEMEMTIGWELELPSEGDIRENDYESMMQSFTLAVRSLPPWMMIHRQDMFIPGKYHHDTPDNGSLLSREYFGHFEGREFCHHKCYLYLTSTSEDMMSRAGGSAIFRFKANPDVPTFENVTEFLQDADRFIGCLTSSGLIKATPIADNKWSLLLDTYLCMGDPRRIVAEHRMNHDMVISRNTCAKVYRIEYECGDTIEDTVSTSGVTTGRLSCLGIGLDCPHAINSYILTLPQQKEYQRLSRRIKRLQNIDFDIRSKSMRKDMEAFMEESTSRYIVMGHTNVILWEELDKDERESSLISAAASLGYSISQECSLSASIWFSGIPGTATALSMDNMRRMDLHEQISGCIWETYQKPLNGGNILLCDRVRHIPVALDFQSAAVKAGIADNLNAFLLGSSGSGKSFLMNHLARSMYDSGGNVTIIDIGDSYKVPCGLINESSDGKDGIYNEWNDSADIHFSLFDNWRSWTTDSGEIAADSTGFRFLGTLILRIAEGSTDQMSVIFPQVVMDFIRSYIVFLKDKERMDAAVIQEASLDGFYLYLKSVVQPKIECTSGNDGYFIASNRIAATDFDMNSFCIQLSPFVCGGKYGSIFKEETLSQSRQKSRFTVYELEKVSSDEILFPIVTLCILHRFESLMNDKTDEGTVKTLIIEEAWKSIASRSSAAYISELWKTARKKNGSAVVVTQQWSDLESDIVKDTILCNSATKILMNGVVTPETVDKTLPALGIDSSRREVVLSLGKGLPYKDEPSRDVFINIGSGYAKAFSIEVSKAERLAYESSKPKKKSLLESASKKGSITKALTDLL